MSLHKFAEQVAANGRGDDSLLVHMTPDEVQRLQAFAEANGRSLTINPTTGLPEAGFLSDLFKAVAPIALGAFLGPGAFGIAGLGLSAGTAGLVTGGLTTLATGSLSRGLMAGLGAYGGAGLAEGLMGAGVGAAQQSAMGSLSADQIAAEMANTELTKQGVLNQAAADATKSAMANTGQAVSSGFNAVTSTPSAMGAFAKQNLGNIAAAAAPIMAGAMVPTTTKMPVDTNPAYIRQKLYDPFTQTYKSLTPIKASEFGNRNFSDAYTNPQTGQMATLDQRQPTPMAGGGIVALAAGGYKPTDTEIFDYFKTPGLTDAKIAQDMQTFGVSAADIARATGTQDKQANYEQRFVQTLNAPGTDASEFQKATSAVGLQGQALTNAMQGAGLSQGAQYALTQPGLNDIGFTGGIIDATTGKPVDLYNQIGYIAGALPGDQAGLEGLYGNINYVTKGLQNLINTGKMSVGDAQNAAIAELTRTKVSMGDVEAATGKKFGDLFKPKPVTKIDDKTTVTGGTGNDIITGTGGTGTGGTGTGINTGVIPGGFYGNATNPGDITTNLDGTVTVHPNIPYRPDGGFSGMGEVRGGFTKGGGSLGYTAPIPKDPEAAFNTLTDDSLDAYRFLMGKGKNLAQANAARSRPLMQPYFTGANRYKPKFLSYDKDGNVVSSDGSKNTSGAAGTTKVINEDGTINQEATDKANFDYVSYLKANPDVQAELDKGIANFGTKDDLASAAYNHYVTYGKAQKRPLKAAGGGMMGYAMGGGLGSLGSYSDGGRLLKGPGDGVSDSIPATIGAKQQPARLADGEFVIPARIVSELGNGSTEAGAKKLYAMMDRVQRARGKTTGKNKVAANSRADKYLPA
jgi:hypothetical protein